ncbi:MAG: hypothetical protein JNM94_05275 [Phycisphaerae bacterium]|nr:hypothetical protein [Phycisphaerae bacterium]
MSAVRALIRRSVETLPGTSGVRLIRWVQDLRVPALRDRRREHARILARLGNPDEILAGPFRGMRYGRFAWGSQLLPKFVGTYELELHAALESLIASEPDVVVDVGAAEGYYAVGLARRLPRSTVVTFDTSPASRRLLGALASQNGVAGQVHIRGTCAPSTLEAALATAVRPAVIIDCEGYEDLIADPIAVPSLARATLVVETHEPLVPGVEGRIRERFAATHHVETLPQRPRSPHDLPAGVRLKEPGPASDVAECMNEYRWDGGVQTWLWMRPREKDEG